MQMRGPANVPLLKRVLSGHGVRRSFQGVYARSCQPLRSNPRRRGRQPVEVPRTGRTHIIFLYLSHSYEDCDLVSVCHTAMVEFPCTYQTHRLFKVCFSVTNTTRFLATF